MGYLPAEVNAQLVRSMAQMSPSGSQLCVGFIADASKLPQQAKPVYAPPISEFSALLRAHDWAGELQVDRFGDARLNFGRYPAGTPPDAMQCFALSTSDRRLIASLACCGGRQHGTCRMRRPA